MTTIMQLLVATAVESPEESVTRAVKENVPAWVGVPVIAPVVASRFRPDGRFPEASENV